MRLRTVILCLLFCFISVSAKDVITKTDGTKLDAKVEEITETHIKYRKASNLTGPVYTIAIESVATITYENGEVEKFNDPSSTSTQQITRNSGLSDEELIHMSKSEPVSPQNYGMSDADLLRLSMNSEIDKKMLNKAKISRRIGWIGGGTIFVAGLIGGLTLWSSYDWDSNDSVAFLGIAGGSLVLASAWTLAFNMRANSLMKKAAKMQAYSIPLIENEIINFGNKFLTAGINMMGNRMIRSYSFGPSIGLTF